MRKYSDYECKSCDRIIKDLPLEAKACPMCGKRRGFKRIYASQISTKGHRIGRFVDRRLQPAYDAKSGKGDGQQFEKDSNVALDKAWELAPTAQREAAVAANGGQKPTKMRMHNVPAGSAMGMIDPQARRDTREMVWPMIENRPKPRPEWQR